MVRFCLLVPFGVSVFLHQILNRVSFFDTCVGISFGLLWRHSWGSLRQTGLDDEKL